MSRFFKLLGATDRKTTLENASHPCPRCKHSESVQLNRIESELYIFNKRIEFPSSMTVRYECNACSWKNEALPDDDPSFNIMPISTIEDDMSDYSPYDSNKRKNQLYNMGFSGSQSTIMSDYTASLYPSPSTSTDAHPPLWAINQRRKQNKSNTAAWKDKNIFRKASFLL